VPASDGRRASRAPRPAGAVTGPREARSTDPWPTLSAHLEAATAAGGLGVDLAAVLEALAAAGARLAREIARAAFTGALGEAGTVNLYGDRVRRLDRIADALFREALRATGVVAVVASEELPRPLAWTLPAGRAGFAVCLDPLDGSLNTDVAGVMGTIFGVRRGPAPGAPDPARAVLGPGSGQVAAGYLVYGSATVFVYTVGSDVCLFVLDPADGRFRRVRAGIRMPARGRTYAVNHANAPDWAAAPRALVDWLRRPGAGAAPHVLRYCGALVADFHRILLEGGLYLYPPDATRPDGRLRLLYEAAPLALVAEAAGGAATTGCERLLDVIATRPEQPVPLYIGSREEVERAEACHRGPRPGEARPSP
jgi:fructose-1,6-bisphosphatase I